MYSMAYGKFLAALKKYERGCSDPRYPYGHLFDIAHCNPHALDGSERRNVRDDKNVLDVVHAITSTSTRYISSATIFPNSALGHTR
jgi:hypothetical protein